MQRFFLTGFRPYLILTLICACLYTPGLTAIPVLDRDEARYVQATRQMLESGDFIDIRFQEEPRYKKPVAVYWLQAATVALVSDAAATEVWPYRIPSAVGAWIAVLLTFAFGARLLDRRSALLGAVLLASSLMLMLEAHQAKTDAVLLATVVATLGALGHFYVAARRQEELPVPKRWIGGMAAVFWISLGLGVLVKGPVLPMVVVATTALLVAWDRDWRWLRPLQPLKGMLLAALVVLPWAGAMAIESGLAFFTEAVEGDILPKLISGHESHGAPPGYYALLMVAFFWPGSLLALPALVAAWGERTAAGVRFCFAWLIPAWIVFELVPTKLPHYVLPLYPALALLTAYAVLAAVAAGRAIVTRRWPVVWYGAWAAVGGILAVAAIAVPPILGDGFTAWSLLAAPAAAGAGAAGFILARRQRPLAALAAGVTLGAVALVTIMEGVVVRASDLWVSRSIHAVVADLAPAPRPPVAVSGFSEPSVVFLLGTDTVLGVGAVAAEHLLAEPDALAVVEERQESAFRDTLGDQVDALESLASVTGLNYSRGRTVTLTVYRLASP
ncbi:MAG: glycosyltransferase family 39 protein [Rhodospirillales bacterium]|nr:MAG: glycosyltransferase family 39 protein [Rhodospirillales bacterium]